MTMRALSGRTHTLPVRLTCNRDDFGGRAGVVCVLTLSVTGRPNEAEFIEAVEAAKSRFDAGEIDRDEYHERVARASSRYRRATDP